MPPVPLPARLLTGVDPALRRGVDDGVAGDGERAALGEDQGLAAGEIDQRRIGRARSRAAETSALPPTVTVWFGAGEQMRAARRRTG